MGRSGSPPAGPWAVIAPLHRRGGRRSNPLAATLRCTRFVGCKLTITYVIHEDRLKWESFHKRQHRMTPYRHEQVFTYRTPHFAVSSRNSTNEIKKL